MWLGWEEPDRRLPQSPQGRMHRLLESMGNPQSAWKVVHVTGTKGKGSTARMVSDILAASQYRVGLYTR